MCLRLTLSGFSAYSRLPSAREIAAASGLRVRRLFDMHGPAFQLFNYDEDCGCYLLAYPHLVGNELWLFEPDRLSNIEAALTFAASHADSFVFSALHTDEAAKTTTPMTLPDLLFVVAENRIQNRVDYVVRG